MADVKWIKITTDIFDDEKILLIESMPAADSIIVIWFKLLTFAGKQNNNGVFLMSNRIAYTDEMLATIFRREVNTVRLALQTFEQFGMIEILNDVITIPNWNKHQTLDAYEKKKQRDRLYQAERRASQRALVGVSSDMSPDTSPDKSSDVAISEKEEDIEGEVDIEGDKEKNNNLFIHDSEKNFFTSPENPEKPAAKHKFDAETLAAKQADYRAAIRKALTLGGEAGAKRAYDYERIANLIGIPGVSVAAIREELNAEKEDHVSA